MMILAALAACAGPVDEPSLDVTPQARDKVRDDTLHYVSRELVALREPEVLVVYAPSLQTEADAATAGFDDQRYVRMAVTKAAVQRDLQRDVGANISIARDYDHLPIQLLRVKTSAAMSMLLEDPRVLAVDQVRFAEASDTESLALIGQPAAAAEGKTGAGTAVAVIDTGVDFTRDAFGSCTAPNSPAATCRVVHAQDFAVEDGVRDSGVFHGTNVAGIVAAVAPEAQILGLDVFAGSTAPSTAIIDAINFVIANKTRFNIAAMNLSLGALNGGGPFTSPCGTEPMAVAIQNARSAGILSAVATGNNGFTNGIGAPACGPASVSVAAVFDSGGFSISCPAGGTEAAVADRVTCFSNTSSFTTMAAPGSVISAAGLSMQGTSQAAPHVAGAIAVLKAIFPQESPDEIVARLTSTGTPVSRGALTLPRLNLAAAGTGCVFGVTPTRIDASNDAAHTVAVELRTSPGCAWQTSTTGGFLTVTPASGSGSATLSVALTANSGSVRSGEVRVSPGPGSTATERVVSFSQGSDTTPPTGTVVINSGAAATNVATVSLAITATDPSGVPLMCVSQTTTCSSFEPFATSQSIALSATGSREVRVFLRDGRGNTTSATAAPRDGIIFDTAGPTGGALTVVPGISQLQLSWTAASDAPAGVGGYRVFAAPGAIAPTCAGTPLLETNETVRTATIQASNNVAMQIRICPFDKAGNVGPGFTGTGMARTELSPPTGSITVTTLTPGFTRTAAVSITVNASDPSMITGLCISAATTCTTFEPITPTQNLTRQGTFSVTATPGPKAINLFLRDGLGNTSTTPADTATIVFDGAAPSVGNLTATPGNGAVTLAVGGVTDTPAGVASFRVVRAEGTPAAPPVAPASCDLGIPSGDFTTTTMTIGGLTNRTVHAFRVCAIDRAGNMSAGAVRSAEPRAEFVVPAATVLINGGAIATNTTALSVAVAVTEDVGIESMCIGFAATGCTPFVDVSPSESTAPNIARSVTLPTTAAGVRSVFVTLRDVSGNTMTAAASDTIIFDQAPPTGGALRVTPGNTTATLAWTAPTDTPAGIRGYRLRFAEGLAPATCADGEALADETTLRPPTTSFVHQSLTNSTNYGWRLCAVDHAGNVASGITITGQPRAEFQPPTASVVINRGAAFTRTTDVSVRITGTDASGVASFCMSDAAGPCSVFLPFTGSPLTVPATVPNTPGVRTIFVTLRDLHGNTMTTPASDSITLDTTAPVGGVLTVAPLVSSLRLSWTASTDASGIAQYLIMAGSLTPTDCSGTPAGTSTSTSFTHASVANGIPVRYRVCPVDSAGNVGAGFVGEGTPRAELTGPVASITINGGAASTNSPALTVALTASDPSGVAGVCLATTTAACTTFQAYDGSPTTLPATVTNTAGQKSVFVTLRDALGNTSTTSKSITLDLTPPTGGVLTVTPRIGSLQLSWTAAADPGGISGYRLLAGSTTPANCSGTPVATVTGNSFLHTGLTNGAPVRYRVCPVDGAGNVGVGFIGEGVARAELTGPVATIRINNGAAFTNSAALSVVLSATDESGTAGLCVATSSTGCTTTFEPFDGAPQTRTVTTTPTAGVKTVFVRLRDVLGNESTASASITLDLAGPTGGAATASTPQANAVLLTWTASTDPAGIVAYRIATAAGTTPPANCTGALLQTTAGDVRTFLHSGLPAGARAYRICAVDGTGNVGVGFTVVGTPRGEVDPPVATVVINDGAPATNNNIVRLTVSATDASGPGGVCVGNTSAPCTTFVAMTGNTLTIPAFTMTNTVGVRTVFVTVRDTLGNTMTTPASDSIILDRTAPSGLSLSADPGAGKVNLSWAGSDPTGIRRFRLVVLQGTIVPAVRCTNGTALVTDSSTTFSHTGVSGILSYRLCAEDEAGNVADGVVRSVTVRAAGARSPGCGRALLAADFRDQNGDGNPESETTLVVGGLSRRAAIRLPANYDPDFPHAIVYELHGDQNAGFTPDPSTFTNGIFGADEYGGGAIVIALRGENILASQVRDDFASFVSWDTLSPPASNLDIQALRAFRVYVEDKACVEIGNVSVVGFSGGGFLAQTMRCFGEEFRAVANFQSGLDFPDYPYLRDDAGAPIHLDTSLCATTPMPQLVIHLDGDATVDPAQGLDTAEFWASRHGCQGLSLATGSPLDPECVEFTGCGIGEDVALCTPPGGGHEVWSPEGAQVLVSFFNRFF